MYTFKQAAELAGLHENTARTYRDRFQDFFSWTGEGRRRRYAENTVSILKSIGEKVAQNLTQEQIQTELELEYGIFIDTTSTKNTTTTQEENNHTTTPTQFMELMRVAVAKELQNRDAQITELKAELQESRKAIETEFIRISVANELQSRDVQIAELKAELQESRKAIEALINERDSRIIEQIREIMNEKRKPSWWQFWK
jgi:DNA-binding transcriptional MerR regulator